MRIATWNVNSVLARLPRLVEWLGQASPDVVCLQETKVEDFPADAVEPLGYQVEHLGEGRWNGVALLSRVGFADVTRGLPDDPGFPDPGTREARTLAATCGPVRVRSVYVPNGRSPDDPHYAYKLRWLAALRPVAGLAWCVLLVLPWFLAIIVKSGDTFFVDSVERDMLAKVFSGQEAHGAPPGAYFIAFWATFWPGATFAGLALPSVWASRLEKGARALYRRFRERTRSEEAGAGPPD